MEDIYHRVRDSVDTWVVPYGTELKGAWIGLAFIAYFILTTGLLTARYGRHFSENSVFLTLNGKFGWMVQEIISPLTLILFFRSYQRPGGSGSIGQILSILWLVHYFNRAVLSVVLAPGMKSTRVDTVLMSVLFNFINAGWVGHDLGLLNSRPFTITPRTSLGLVMFLVGMAINISADYHLQSMRRQKGSGEYVLPNWGLYKYILSPNYAGEIIEWTGYSLMLRRQSGWVFVLWTVCNLVPRARSNLEWYKEKFGEKLGRRKSIIPGVY